tara:strand:+ start:224442 stop:225824 length:1383 start_codon:yes stop_codon:yes gene_type:complete
MALTAAEIKELQNVVNKDYDAMSEGLGLAKSVTFKALVATNTQDSFILDGIKDGISDQIKGKFPNITKGDLEANTNAITNKFGNDPVAIAQFMLDTGNNQEFDRMRNDAKTPEEALKVTSSAIDAYKSGRFDQFASQTVSNNPAPLEAAIKEVAPETITAKSSTPAQETKPDTVAEKQVDKTQAVIEKTPEQALEALIEEHLESYPEGAEREAEGTLAGHFLANAAGDPPADPQLKKALETFAKNNADMLKAGSDGDMVSEMLDKKAMIHDLLASYKDTPEKAYEALAAENFQMQAFLQYSPIGQAAGFILEPLLQMFGGLMGQGSNLAGWAEADFGDIMKDFKGFFSNEMGNVMGMGNNDLGLFERLGKVVNAVGYAAEDALDVTRYDRHYMKEHNPDAGKIKIKSVGEGNDIKETTIDLAGGPAAIEKPIDPFDPNKPENNDLNKGLEAPAINNGMMS